MRLRQFTRQPLLHFLLLGGLLFLAHAFLPPRTEPIRFTAADVEQLRQDWRRDTGRLPTPEQLQASLDRWLDEEVLLREALRLRLDRRDAVARRRLLMNLHFAFPESSASEAALLSEAGRLAMQQSDLVARRRLILVMEQRLRDEMPLAEEELRDYIVAHPGRYAAAPRYSFRQVFVDMRGPQAEIEAQRLLAALRAAPDPAVLPGDPFLLGEGFRALTLEEIARSFGAPFAQAVKSAAPKQWSGPIASAYGLHLLQIDPPEPGAPIELTAVRRQAAYALLAEREVQRLAEARAELRRRYRVEAGSGVPAELSS